MRIAGFLVAVAALSCAACGSRATEPSSGLLEPAAPVSSSVVASDPLPAPSSSVATAEASAAPTSSASTAPSAAALPPPPSLGPPPGFTCAELGTQAVPDVGCTTNYHRRETGMVPVFDLKPTACQKVADHEAALHAVELEGLGVAAPQIKTRVAAFKTKNRATWAKACAGGLRVWAKEFDCYVRAASPAEAAQCGDFSLTSSRL